MAANVDIVHKYKRLDTLGRNITDELKRLSIEYHSRENETLITELLLIELKNKKA